MIKSIGFFCRGDVYDWGECQTVSFAEALKRQGIKVEMYGLPTTPLREILARTEDELPDVYCSLMMLDDRVTKDCLLDYHNIPYVMYSVDLSAYYFHIAFNEKTIITSIDKEDLALLDAFGYNRTFHLPLACERDIEANFSDDKPYPISYIGTCWDYETEVDIWKKKLTPQTVDMMLDVCEAVMQGHSQLQVLDQMLSKRGLKADDVPFCVMHRQITQYIKGRDRVELVRSIEKHPIHIFGRNNLHKGWEYYLKGKDNVILHDPVNFDESLKIMQQSKILLNGAPQFRHGIHDRVFNGLGSGALVLTDRNPEICTSFTDEKDILLYTQGDLDHIDEKIAPYLENDSLRNELVKRGRKKVLKSHTWDHRAKVFIKEVSRIKEKMACLKK